MVCRTRKQPVNFITSMIKAADQEAVVVVVGCRSAAAAALLLLLLSLFLLLAAWLLRPRDAFFRVRGLSGLYLCRKLDKLRWGCFGWAR